jgi:hypothetical protein
MGEEITLETAILDFEIHELLTLRAGVILSPLGRFNLAHDSPANDLVERRPSPSQAAACGARRIRSRTRAFPGRRTS